MSHVTDPSAAPAGAAGAAAPPRPARRILYVCNNPSFFATYRGRGASAALGAGYEVHVATPSGDGVDAILRAGFAHHPIPLVRRSKRPASEWRTIAALRRLYVDLQPDVIEQMTIKPILYGSLAARSVGIGDRVINWMAGLGFLFVDRAWLTGLIRPVVLAAYRAALSLPGSHAVFENPDHLEFFVSRGLVAPDRGRVIDGAGVPMDAFVPSPPPAGPPVVMFAGRMIWDKGVREFIDAVRILRDRGSRARFTLLGAPDPGNPASVDIAQLQAWHDGGLVEWRGHSNDMASEYRGCTVFCFPTAYAEGVPRVLIEAAASARPIVTTDMPGCREVVRHGENGLLVAPRSAAAVATAVEALLGAPERAMEMGARGRGLVVGRFSVPTVLGRTLALYDAVGRGAGR